MMRVIDAEIKEVLLLEPKVFADERGFFMENYNKQNFAQLGINLDFVQDNYSASGENVLRGLHSQIQQPQGKLVRVVAGEVFDVAVDLRKSSPTFGKWVGAILSAENKRMLWVPPEFGHGFQVLSQRAEFIYKTTDYYAPEFDRCIRYDDPDLAIDWPGTETPILSEKDQAGSSFKQAEIYP